MNKIRQLRGASFDCIAELEQEAVNRDRLEQRLAALEHLIERQNMSEPDVRTQP